MRWTECGKFEGDSAGCRFVVWEGPREEDVRYCNRDKVVQFERINGQFTEIIEDIKI
jgi:hypothetical protein